MVSSAVLSSTHDSPDINHCTYAMDPQLESQLIRVFVQRILRCLFEKDDSTYDTDAPISSRQQVTVAIIEAFELYNETYFLDSH